MTEFGRAKDILSARLRLRAEYWRRKAKAAREKGDGVEELALGLRSREAQECAEIAAGLSEEYRPPDEPDMLAARRAGRGKGSR